MIQKSRRIRLSSAARVMVFVLVPACGVTSLVPETQVTGPEIIERAFKVYGGRMNYLGLEHLLQESRVVAFEKEGGRWEVPFRLEFSRPDLLRVETETRDGAKLVQILADGNARQWIDGVELASGDLATHMRRRLEYMFMLALPMSVPANKMVLVGTPTIGDRPTYALEIERGDTVVTLYFDQTTFHLRRILEKSMSGGEPLFKDVYLDGYRIVNGRPMPWSFVTLINEEKVSEAKMVQAEVGRPIPRERFEGP